MNNNIDWQDVENKISLICYKFSNLSRWQEDLAQELRIHAYYVSDDYYDLVRKAIDFWRKIQTHYTPETPYFDLDILGIPSKNAMDFVAFDEMVALIKKELNRPGYNVCDQRMLNLADKIFTIIVNDIDPHAKRNVKSSSTTKHYHNQRLNLTWVSEELGVSYQLVSNAMKFLEATVLGLAAMGKIEIPEDYFKGYF